MIKIWAIQNSAWNKISSIKVYETITISHIWTYFSVLALGLLPPAAILWAMRSRFCCKVSSSNFPLEDGSSTFADSTFFPITCKGTHGENNLTPCLMLDLFCALLSRVIQMNTLYDMQSLTLYNTSKLHYFLTQSPTFQDKSFKNLSMPWYNHGCIFLVQCTAKWHRICLRLCRQTSPHACCFVHVGNLCHAVGV